MAKKEISEEEKKKNAEIATNMHSKGTGLVLRNLDDMALFARTAFDAMTRELTKSGLDSPGKVILALETGQELGLPPMASLRSIAVIGGKPTIYGDAGLALVRKSGLLESIKEVEPTIREIGKDLKETSDEVKAICTVKRKEDAESTVREFSVAEARQANLWGKVSKDGKAMPWTTHPGRMLKLKARAFALRDTFPDVLMGLNFFEEMQGIEMPTEAPTPEVPGREERKQAEDVKVTDTKELVRDLLEKTLGKFCGSAAYSLEISEDDCLNKEAFAKACEIILEDTETDFTNEDSFTIDNLTTITTYIEHAGVPDEALALIPVEKKEPKPTEKDEEKDPFPWHCNGCGHDFPEPKKGARGIKLCPDCHSKDVIENKEREKVKK